MRWRRAAEGREAGARMSCRERATGEGMPVAWEKAGEARAMRREGVR